MCCACCTGLGLLLMPVFEDLDQMLGQYYCSSTRYKAAKTLPEA